jgi:NADH-ubiquinone oxidoreductase chain 4
LAGVLLKLGGYGLLHIFSILMDFFKWGFIWVSVSFIGGLVVSLICIRQTNLKSLIAYSSVAHMGIVIGGTFADRGCRVVSTTDSHGR